VYIVRRKAERALKPVLDLQPLELGARVHKQAQHLVQAVLERLSKARTYRHKVRDVLRQQGVVVGTQVIVEKELG
jgi:hypothetical protein